MRKETQTGNGLCGYGIRIPQMKVKQMVAPEAAAQRLLLKLMRPKLTVRRHDSGTGGDMA